jgi:hypothetical protein
VSLRLAAAGLVLAMGCDVGSTPTGLDPAVVEGPIDLVYALQTDWDDVPLVSGARVWTTALGYELELTRWDLLTTSVELVPCQSDEVAAWMWMAHASYTHDASVVEPDLDESLLAGAPVDLGRVQLGGGPYCSLFSVHRKGDTSAVSRLEGRFRRPGQAWTALDASHPLVLTSLPDLPAAGAPDLSSETRVVLTRYPARALDAIDFEALSPLDVAYDASHGLLLASEVTLLFGAGRLFEG